MASKRIKLPPRAAVGSNKDGPVLWGMAEFLLNVVFVRDDLYSNKEYCEVIAALHPKVTKLKGEAQEGQSLDMSGDELAALIRMALPATNNSLMPEIQYLVALCRLALHGAATVEEEKAKAEQPS